MYLDIIRRYRPDKHGRPPGAAATRNVLAGGVAGAPSTTRAANRNLERPSLLQVEDVLAEISQPGSGPAKALGTYREKPNAERLGWLTKAILRAQGKSTEEWERCVPVVAEATKEMKIARCPAS